MAQFMQYTLYNFMHFICQSLSQYEYQLSVCVSFKSLLDVKSIARKLMQSDDASYWDCYCTTNWCTVGGSC